MNVTTIFPIDILFRPKHPNWFECNCQNMQTASLLEFLWFLNQHGFQTDRALTRCSELIAISTFSRCQIGFSDVVKEEALCPSLATLPLPEDSAEVQSPRGLSLLTIFCVEIPMLKSVLKHPRIGLSVGVHSLPLST